ncbi:MAG TPA: exonuclease subunit SbcD [Clostridia bacterium]
MKILHTADLHLGKKLFNVDRLEEQQAVMDEIIEIADREKVDIALIAGDVFDTALPSAAAESLFYESMVKLGRLCTVVVIAGNHDDPVRLSAAKEMALYCNIVIAGEHDITYSAKKITAGKGYIQMDINGERAVINLLPYPSDSRLGDVIDPNSTYIDRVKNRLYEGALGFREDTININLSHLFCVGGVKEGDEREIELGGARIIPIDTFPKAHYTALGHIHKPQTISKTNNIYYSGSIMPYAFDESNQKSVIIADIDKNGIKDLKRVPITKYKSLIRLAADNVMHAMEMLEKNSEKWVWLDLKLQESLTDSDSKALKAFPNLLRLQLILPERKKINLKDRIQKSDRQIFIEYYQSQFGTQPKEELINLFLEIMESNV